MKTIVWFALAAHWAALIGASASGETGGKEEPAKLAAALRDSRSIPDLAKALQHDSDQVRVAAIQRLVELKSLAKLAVPELTGALKDKVFEVRFLAATALHNAASAAQPALPALLALLKDEDARMRDRVGEAIRNIVASADELAPFVEKAIASGDAATAIPLVARMGAAGPGAVPALSKALASPDAELRRTSARTLGDMAGDARKAVPDLLAALKDSKEEVRLMAAEALWRIERSPRAVEFWMSSLKDESAKVRQAAAVQLGFAGSATERVDDLAALLKDKDLDVRLATAAALGRLGPAARGAAPGLLEALKAPEASLRREAAAALPWIAADDKVLLPALAGLIKDPAPRVVQEAVAGLSVLARRSKEASAALVEAARHANADVRRGAASGLALLAGDDKAALAALSMLASDKDEGVRDASLRSAPRAGAAAVPMLVEALKGKDIGARRSALQALARIGPAAKSAAPSAADCLEDVGTRREAAAALLALDPSALAFAQACAAAWERLDAVARADFVDTQLGRKHAALTPVLITAAQDKNEDVSFRALSHLRDLETAAKPALPALIAVVKNRKARGWRVAVSAIEQLGPEAKDAIPALIDALNNDADRFALAAAFKAIGPAAIPPLVAAYGGKDSKVKLGAALALRGLNAKEAAPLLREDMKHPEGHVRVSAAFALQALDPASDVETVFLGAIKDKDVAVRRRAVFALQPTAGKSKAAADALKEALADENTLIEAAQGLMDAKQHLDEVVLALRRALKNDRNAFPAAQLLGDIGAPAASAIPDLRLALKHKDDQVQAVAAESLGKMGAAAAEAVPDLIVMMRTAKPAYLRQPAVHALGKIGPAHKEVLAAILEPLRQTREPALGGGAIRFETSDARLVEAAVDALVDYGPEGAPALVKLSANDAALTARALDVLERLGPKAVKAHPDVVGWFKMRDDSRALTLSGFETSSFRIQQQVAAALFKMGPEVIPALRAALRDGDIRIRQGAALTLGKFGPVGKDAAPELVLALKDDSLDLRWLAAQALGKMGPAASSAAPALIEALKDESPLVRSLAGWSLTLMGEDAAKKAAPALLALTSDNSGRYRFPDPWQTPRARAIAHNALVNLGPLGSEATPMLIEMLQRNDVYTRRDAAETLGRLGSLAKDAVPALRFALLDDQPMVQEAAAKALKLIDR